MLDPNQRSLYTTLLTPPPGYVLDDALGTTYSLDPSTLLTIPVHFALMGDENKEDGIAVFEALRRVLGRLTLYVQRGQIQAPEQGNELYGLLSRCMVEVDPPGNGVFHPKFWVLRFRSLAGDEPPRLRLLVLSRNVTGDRSWDLSLQLEGEIGEERVSTNKPLAQLIRRLPKLACQAPTKSQEKQATAMARDVSHCEFELPEGVKKLSFQPLGLDGTRWGPGRCDRLAVISPFCSDQALGELVADCTEPVALISRPDAFNELGEETRALFSSCRILHEAAESEDNEEDEVISQDRFGLHAKVYIAEKGTRTRLTMGSANATNAALRAVHNIELLVTLEGLQRKLGNIESLLGDDGLGGVLVDYLTPETPPEIDEVAAAARQRLEEARKAVGEAGLSVVCEAREEDDRWRLVLQGGVSLPESVRLRVWPISRSADHAVRLEADGAEAETELAVIGPAYVTGVLGFELKDSDLDESLRFVLNLPVESLPEEEREAAILRAVVNNRDGFLRYLMLLLASEEDGAAGPSAGAGAGFGRWVAGFGDDLPLLEELTRAYSREPERLRDIGRMVTRLRSREDAKSMIPESFETIWAVYEKALERGDG